MGILKKIAHHFARKSFCRNAIDQHADLSAFRERPTLPRVSGLILIAFSYVIGLPAVVALGVIAGKRDEPLIGIIGGPLIYGLSTLIFFIGIKLAGKKYLVALSRWLSRIILEKILGDEVKAPCTFPPDGSGSEQPKNKNKRANKVDKRRGVK